MNGSMNMSSAKMMQPRMKKRAAVISQYTFMMFFSLPSAMRLPTPALRPSDKMFTR